MSSGSPLSVKRRRPAADATAAGARQLAKQLVAAQTVLSAQKSIPHAWRHYVLNTPMQDGMIGIRPKSSCTQSCNDLPTIDELYAGMDDPSAPTTHSVCPECPAHYYAVAAIRLEKPRMVEYFTCLNRATTVAQCLQFRAEHGEDVHLLTQLRPELAWNALYHMLNEDVDHRGKVAITAKTTVQQVIQRIFSYKQQQGSDDDDDDDAASD